MCVETATAPTGVTTLPLCGRQWAGTPLSLGHDVLGEAMYERIQCETGL